MNDPSHLMGWLQLLGMLALEIAVLIGCVAGWQQLARSAAWRRTLWQACLAGVLVLAFLELAGLSGRLNDWVRAPGNRGRCPEMEAARPASMNIGGGQRAVRSESSARAGSFGGVRSSPDRLTAGEPGRDELRESQSREIRASYSSALRNVRLTSENRRERSDWLIVLLGGVWLGGTLLVAARLGGARLSFWAWRHLRHPVTDANRAGPVQALAQQVGVRRAVRLVESERFSCPVAYGWLHPTIGLPAEFEHDYSPAEQEVMLAHELAHLASRDPLWYTLADLAAALFWWHGLVWWVRRQFQAACEAAADESCLLVRDGPALLAECLVSLSAHLARSPRLHWIGIEGAGFRSGLGRRVARLADLPGRGWRPPARWRTGLARTVAPAMLVVISVACVAWTLPQTSNKGSNMKTYSWKQSLAALAVLAALDSGPASIQAAEPDPRQPAGTDVAVRPARAAPPWGALATPMESKEVQALRARLDAITFDSVMYDGLPLSEVVKHLMDEAAKKSPDKGPVNFLFSKAPSPSAQAVDPATGLPPQGTEAVDLPGLVIRIIPPLHHVRMIDVLDAITKVAEPPMMYSLEGYAVVFSLGRADASPGGPAVPRPPTAAGGGMMGTGMGMGGGGMMSAGAMPGMGGGGMMGGGAMPGMGGGVAMTKRAGMAEAAGGPFGLPTLQTRAFGLPRLFFANAEKAFGTKISTDSPEHISNGLQEVFGEAGVRKPVARIAYNENVDGHFTGSLLVRANPEDMEVIQATIQFLGGSSWDSSRSASSLPAASPNPFVPRPESPPPAASPNPLVPRPEAPTSEPAPKAK